MSLPAWPAVAAAAAAVAVVGLTAACSAETAAAAPNQPDDAFTQCLTDNGVPAPPEGGPGGHGPGGERPAGPPPGERPHEGGIPPAPPDIDQGVWDSAMQACHSLAPAPPSP